MNVVVVGAGAVGGYFGGRLVESGLPVTFLCRGATRAAIEQNGLRIESISGNARVRPDTVERPDGSVQADLMFWAVKTYQTADAVTVARPMVGDQTSVVSLQNGIDAVDDLGAAFGKEKIIGGFASIAAESTAPGVVRHTGLGKITVGELRGGGETERLRAVAGLLERAKIPHKISDNIRRDLWGKLVWNAAFNPLSVLLYSTVEDLLSNVASVSILKRAMDEVVMVAKSEGHELSPKLIEIYLNPKDQAGEFYTSMLQDFKRKRPLESDAISGAVVRHARRQGIEVPVNELFFDSLRYLQKETSTESGHPAS